MPVGAWSSYGTSRMPALVTGAIHAYFGGRWTLSGSDVTSLIDQVGTDNLAPSSGTVPTNTQDGRNAWGDPSGPFSYMQKSTGFTSVTLTKGSLLFLVTPDLTGFGSGAVCSFGGTLNDATQNWVQVNNSVGGPQFTIFAGGTSFNSPGGVTGGAPPLVLLTWDSTPVSGSRKLRWYAYGQTGALQSTTTNTSTMAMSTTTALAVNAALGIGVPRNVFTTFQLGNQFIEDAVATAEMARLKAFWLD